MKQTLIKECGSCGLGYYKPWYEPMWLARKNWTQAHDSYHGNSQRDYGKDLEQERIIKLLEEIAETDKYRAIWEIIIAIKGEK